MNKKAFTILELIVSVFIISIIATISIVVFNKNGKNDEVNKIYTSLENAANTYYEMNKKLYVEDLNENGAIFIQIKDLVKNGIIDKNKIYNNEFVTYLKNKKNIDNLSDSELVLSNIENLYIKYYYNIENDKIDDLILNYQFPAEYVEYPKFEDNPVNPPDIEDNSKVNLCVQKDTKLQFKLTNNEGVNIENIKLVYKNDTSEELTYSDLTNGFFLKSEPRYLAIKFKINGKEYTKIKILNYKFKTRKNIIYDKDNNKFLDINTNNEIDISKLKYLYNDEEINKQEYLDKINSFANDYYINNGIGNGKYNIIQDKLKFVLKDECNFEYVFKPTIMFNVKFISLASHSRWHQNNIIYNPFFIDNNKFLFISSEWNSNKEPQYFLNYLDAEKFIYEAETLNSGSKYTDTDIIMNKEKNKIYLGDISGNKNYKIFDININNDKNVLTLNSKTTHYKNYQKLINDKPSSYNHIGELNDLQNKILESIINYLNYSNYCSACNGQNNWKGKCEGYVSICTSYDKAKESKMKWPAIYVDSKNYVSYTENYNKVKNLQWSIGDNNFSKTIYEKDSATVVGSGSFSSIIIELLNINYNFDYIIE